MGNITSFIRKSGELENKINVRSSTETVRSSLDMLRIIGVNLVHDWTDDIDAFTLDLTNDTSHDDDLYDLQWRNFYNGHSTKHFPVNKLFITDINFDTKSTTFYCYDSRYRLFVMYFAVFTI